MSTTFIDSIRTWLGDVGNGIQKIIVLIVEGGIIHAKQQLCVGDICISEAEFLQMVQSRSINNSGSSKVSNPNVILDTTNKPVLESESENEN